MSKQPEINDKATLLADPKADLVMLNRKRGLVSNDFLKFDVAHVVG